MGNCVVTELFFHLYGCAEDRKQKCDFAAIAAKSGIGLIEPTARIFVGVAELFAAVLLLIPAARFFGALLGLGIHSGAISFYFNCSMASLVESIISFFSDV